MLNIKLINDIAMQFSEKIPLDAQKFKQDLDKNFRASVQTMLAKLDLVTREEFDIQKGVLEKTRAKVNALLKKLEQLEKQSPKSD